MIKYQLICPDGHQFETWFSDSSTFDAQKAAGHVNCPSCGSAQVEKALMAPSVATSRKRETVQVASHHGMDKDMVAMMRKIRDHVTENAENVGPRFAEEARKIHYKEVEPRGIYGQATREESRELREEGVEFHPLPVLPEDQN